MSQPAQNIAAPHLTLVQGGTVELQDGEALLRDPEGRIVVRFDGRHAQLEVPDGDLVLAAPNGGVRIECRDDIAMSSGRDILQRASRTFRVDASSLVQRAHEAFVDVQGVIQTRGGRMRTLVQKGFDLLSTRTTLVSREETSVDGSRILLG